MEFSNDWEVPGPRIGVIVLSTNLTVEREFRCMAPEGVSYHISRCLIQDTSGDEKEKERVFLGLGNHILDAAAQVAMARPQVILFACTVGSFLGDKDHHEAFCERMTQSTGIPVLTTSSTVLEAFHTLGLSKISLISPYPEAIGIKEKAFFERKIPGLTILSMRHLGIVSSFEKNLVPLATTYRLAKETVHPEAEGLFISCTALRSMELIGRLEAELGIPVVTSTQASLWACLRRLKYRGDPKFGRLFGFE